MTICVRCHARSWCSLSAPRTADRWYTAAARTGGSGAGARACLARCSGCEVPSTAQAVPMRRSSTHQPPAADSLSPPRPHSQGRPPQPLPASLLRAQAPRHRPCALQRRPDALLGRARRRRALVVGPHRRVLADHVGIPREPERPGAHSEPLRALRLLFRDGRGRRALGRIRRRGDARAPGARAACVCASRSCGGRPRAFWVVRRVRPGLEARRGPPALPPLITPRAHSI